MQSAGTHRPGRPGDLVRARFVGSISIGVRDGGFTIVELVVVLLLLGILSVTAMSRMFGSSVYAPSLVSQQLVALGRFAQQSALSRRDATVSLDVDRNADDWRFRVVVTDGVSSVVASEERAAIDNTTLTITNGATVVSFGPTDTIRLNFDGVGALSGGSLGTAALDPSIGVAMTVSGDSSETVCFGSAGHAYRGACS